MAERLGGGFDAVDAARFGRDGVPGATHVHAGADAVAHETGPSTRYQRCTVFGAETFLGSAQ